MNRSFYTAGAWCWIVTGAAHDALDVWARASQPATPLTALERETPFEILGMGRSAYDVSTGVSLGMGAAMITAGGLFLLLGRAPLTPAQQRQAALAGLGASLALLGVAAVWEPLPPIILFGAASASFAAALLGRDGTAPSQT